MRWIKNMETNSKTPATHTKKPPLFSQLRPRSNHAINLNIKKQQATWLIFMDGKKFVQKVNQTRRSLQQKKRSGMIGGSRSNSSQGQCGSLTERGNLTESNRNRTQQISVGYLLNII